MAKLIRGIVGLAFLMGTSWGGEVRAEMSSPAPTVEPRPSSGCDRNAGARIALIAGGAGLFAVSFAPACAGARREMCVPFAGPFLLVARLAREDEASNGAGEGDGIVPPAFAYAAIAGLGVAQIGGAALVTLGLLLPRRERPAETGFVTLAPLVGPGSAQLALAGSF